MQTDRFFGELLKAWRKKSRLTQKQLASRASCSTVTIAKIEGGDRRPSREVALALAGALEISPQELDHFLSAARAPLTAASSAPAASGGRPSSTRARRREQTTTFVGREREIAAAVSRLRGSAGVRLLTLTGAPGVGKSRLAQRISRELEAEFGDGVSLVSLSDIGQPRGVAGAIAAALDLGESPEGNPQAGLKSYLGTRHMLLVLDDFSHAGGAAMLVADLLADCEHLKVLVTSRALLRLRGEYELLVGPFRLPPDPDSLPVARLLDYPAVRLFVDRAQAAGGDFKLTSHNAGFVVEILKHLDGLPLAIELAAARMRFFTPEAMLQRMLSAGHPTLPAATLNLLIDGPQDLPPRQQTMRGAIDATYLLLGEREQLLLSRLSVFAGGCVEETAAAIDLARAWPAAHQPAGEYATLDALCALVDKSMLLQVDAHGLTRYRMLNTIREYALERLRERGEEDRCRARHAEIFLRLAAEAEQQLRGDPSERWLRRLQAETENIGAALRWLAENGRTDDASRLTNVLRLQASIAKQAERAKSRLDGSPAA